MSWTPKSKRCRSWITSRFLLCQVRDPLSDYRRGVRRDPNAFTVLKEDKQWDSWQRGTMAQARAEDLSEILDSNLVPATPEATELFVEKQKFFYALFDKVLLTDKGKLLVRQYASTFDAQKVIRDLTVYANTQLWLLRKLWTCLPTLRPLNSVMERGKARHMALFSAGKTKFDNMNPSYQSRTI
jgi:hypothetical protein